MILPLGMTSQISIIVATGIRVGSLPLRKKRCVSRGERGEDVVVAEKLYDKTFVDGDAL